MTTPSAGGPFTRGAVRTIQIYRHMISPYRPPSCRFTPTCSEYAVDALTRWGLLRGLWLAVVRLAKCGPWHAGGWDPVPEHRAGGDHLQDLEPEHGSINV